MNAPLVLQVHHALPGVLRAEFAPWYPPRHNSLACCTPGSHTSSWTRPPFPPLRVERRARPPRFLPCRTTVSWRILGATSPVEHVKLTIPSLCGVLGAELSLLGPSHAVRRLLVAPLVATPLPPADVHHSLPGVLSAELRPRRTFHTTV